MTALKVLRAQGKTVVEPAADGVRIARGQKALVIPFAELNKITADLVGMAIAFGVSGKTKE